MVSMSSLKCSIAIIAALLLTSCGPDKPTIQADKIFFGGPILTMDDKEEHVDAVAIKNGKIIMRGTKDEALTYQGDQTKLWDLNGKTLLPGFIDAHSHISFAGITTGMMVNLTQPPVGTLTSIPDILEKLRERADQTPKGGWVVGFGYDDQALAEGRHPTRQELDSVSTNHHIVILHVSLHMAVANSLRLKEAKNREKYP